MLISHVLQVDEQMLNVQNKNSSYFVAPCSVGNSLGIACQQSILQVEVRKGNVRHTSLVLTCSNMCQLHSGAVAGIDISMGLELRYQGSEIAGTGRRQR